MLSFKTNKIISRIYAVISRCKLLWSSEILNNMQLLRKAGATLHIFIVHYLGSLFLSLSLMALPLSKVSLNQTENTREKQQPQN